MGKNTDLTMKNGEKYGFNHEKWGVMPYNAGFEQENLGC